MSIFSSSTSVRLHFCARSFTLLLLLVLAGSLHAQDTLKKAPLNPDFTAAQAMRVMSKTNTRSLTNTAPLGFQPSPVDMSHTRGKRIFPARTRASFPAKYDLRTLARVSEVKYQGTANTCWAFATYASMESCALPREWLDFSENNMKNTHGFYDNPDGGNYMMSTAYLARWNGPIAEVNDPYNLNSSYSPAHKPVERHIQDVMFIPDRISAYDNDNIKQALMTYGAIATMMYWDKAVNSTAYNATTSAYYYNGPENVNHGVTIIGWDDDYSRWNFSVPPPGDGAFLVKNSWSSSWGNGGYFYVSYHDVVIGKANALFYGIESPTNFSHIYQYDEFGFCNTYGFGSTTAWFANIFTAENTERLAAASWYTVSPNSLYQLAVYLEPEDGPVSALAPVALQTGIITTPGYHTIRIARPVALQAGQRFSIVVKFSTPGYDYPIPIEYYIPGYTDAAVAESGQSYVSDNGEDWMDLTLDDPSANVCLKAFTDSPLSGANLLVSPEGPRTMQTPITLTAQSIGGQAAQYKFLINPGSGWATLRDYESSPTFIWVPKYTRSFELKVWARDAGSTNAYDVASQPITYTITSPFSYVSVKSSSKYAQAMNTSATLTATATGGAQISYKFLVTYGKETTVLQDYSTVKSCTWTPSQSGSYAVTVWARDIDSTRAYDKAASLIVRAYEPVASLLLQPAITSPRSTRTAINLTAIATGGESVQYKFLIDSGIGWQTLRDYQSSPLYTWKPASVGTYKLKVLARSAGNVDSHDRESQTIEYQITSPLTKVSIQSSPYSLGAIDHPVTFTATTIGGGNIEYQFRIKSGNVTTIRREYALDDSWTWNPGAVGTYTISVLAREYNSTKEYDMLASMTYTVKSVLTGVTLRTSASSPQKPRTRITVTATPYGGARVEYQFSILDNTGWHVLSNFAPANSYLWIPQTRGSYTLKVVAREVGTDRSFERTLPFTIR